MSYVCLQCEYKCKPATQLKYFQILTDSINAEHNSSCLPSHCACSQRLVGCKCDYSSEGALYKMLTAHYALLAPSAVPPGGFSGGSPKPGYLQLAACLCWALTAEPEAAVVLHHRGTGLTTSPAGWSSWLPCSCTWSAPHWRRSCTALRDPDTTKIYLHHQDSCKLVALPGNSTRINWIVLCRTKLHLLSEQQTGCYFNHSGAQLNCFLDNGINKQKKYFIPMSTAEPILT